MKIVENSLPNIMLFSTLFFIDFFKGLGLVLEGFREGFGGSGRLLADFWASFFRTFFAMLSKRAPGGCWAQF